MEGLLFQLENVLRIGIADHGPGLFEQGGWHDLAKEDTFSQGGAKVLETGLPVLVFIGQFGQGHLIEEPADLLAKRLLRGAMGHARPQGLAGERNFERLPGRSVRPVQSAHQLLALVAELVGEHFRDGIESVETDLFEGEATDVFHDGHRRIS